MVSIRLLTVPLLMKLSSEAQLKPGLERSMTARPGVPSLESARLWRALHVDKWMTTAT